VGGEGTCSSGFRQFSQLVLVKIIFLTIRYRQTAGTAVEARHIVLSRILPVASSMFSRVLFDTTRFEGKQKPIEIKSGRSFSSIEMV
jgi:hypothetical protein